MGNSAKRNWCPMQVRYSAAVVAAGDEAVAAVSEVVAAGDGAASAVPQIGDVPIVSTTRAIRAGKRGPVLRVRQEGRAGGAEERGAAAATGNETLAAVAGASAVLPA